MALMTFVLLRRRMKGVVLCVSVDPVDDSSSTMVYTCTCRQRHVFLTRYLPPHRVRLYPSEGSFHGGCHGDGNVR